MSETPESRGTTAGENETRGMADAAAPFVAASPFETVPVALVVSDAEGAVVAANAAARRLGASLGTRLATLAAAPDRPALARLLAGEAHSLRLRLGPSRRRRRVQATAWRCEGARVLWLIEPAPRTPPPEETAARLAHEVQAPIGVVGMAAETALMLLDEGERDPDFFRRQFALIHDQARRALDIITHMRGFGGLRAGPKDVVDVGACVRAVIQARAEALAGAGIAAEVRLPSAPVHVLGQALALEQALRNLVDNACDAIRARRIAGGRITITLSERGGKVRITVADNGGGIPAAARRRLFEPFFTTKPAERASGLGLAIARDIAVAMGGTLGARNRGDGAEFTLSLPALSEARKARARDRR